jgi:hypothetical protein
MKTFIMNRSTRLAVLALAAGAVLSAGTVLNFDDQATSSSGISSVPLTNQYAAEGVLFSLIDASQSFKFNIVPASSPNYATLFFGNGGPGFFKFVDPSDSAAQGYVDQVSFTLLGLTASDAHPGSFSGATIDALDLNGNVIAGQTQIIPTTLTTTSNEVLTFTGQVHEIRFTLTPGTTGLLPFDDVTFGAVMTPEPGTFLLLGAALLVGCFHRKLSAPRGV